MKPIIILVSMLLCGCDHETIRVVEVPTIVEKVVERPVAVMGGLVLDWPIKDHRITSPWGYRTDLKKTGTGGGRSIHPGIDMVPTDRSLIHALIHTSAPGIVWLVCSDRHPDDTFGICVMVQHVVPEWKGDDGQPVYAYTMYAHLSELWVSKGDVVGRDDPVGRMGNTGKAEGYHLHFEVRFDPMDFLSRDGQ